LAGAAGFTAAAFTALGVVAPAAHAAPTSAFTINQAGPEAAPSDGQIQVDLCLLVVADSLTVWRSETGSGKTDQVLSYPDTVHVVAGPQGSNRYKIDRVNGAGTNGWISADSRWTDPWHTC